MDNEYSVENYRWIPLESNPEIFNEYFHGLGLKDNYIFEELYSLEDYKLIQEIDLDNVLGIIANIQKIKPNSDIYQNDNFIDNKNNKLFYMIQTNEITNACGVVGGLQIIGNINKEIDFPFTENSLLDKFLFNKKEAIEYNNDLANNIEWKKFHLSIAKKGTSEIPKNKADVIYHYVSFVFMNNIIYELDGRLNKPYAHNNIKISNKNELLDSVITILRNRINNQEIKENLSIMFLVKK